MTNLHSSLKIAVLFSMETNTHTCPYGLKTKALLRSKGYEVDDQKLTTREQVDEFKSQGEC
jgi:glutaredoxin